ncbi:MAG: hypothetical protein H6624_08105 [Bdellovibrionaceae bacterium]|nr:hypothetical protein [Bdellovibrionales bacterium]MCB9084295.1 hypothetical protein [Pseudobdellovibrionaceae bacterium]
MSQLRWVHIIGHGCGYLAVFLMSKPGAAEERSYSLVGSFEQWHYTSSDKAFFRDDQVSSNTSVLGVDYRWAENPSYLVDLSYIYSGGEQSHNFHLRDIYYQTQILDTQTYWGFKRHTWSQADQTWERGLWQPRFFWDKLRPEQQGMLGIHIDKEIGNNHRLYILVSPFTIPEFGPSFDINSEGQFKSKSPWFRPPPRTTELFSQQVVNYYSLKDPDKERMIGSPTFAIQWSSNWDDFQWSASYAHKPMNQIMPAASTTLDLPSNRMDVTSEANLRYHHIGTLEVGMANLDGWQTWASIISDDPQPNDFPDTWITQTVDRAFVWTAYVGYDFEGEDNQNSQAYVTYSFVDGGDARDQGEFAKDNSYYEHRYQYTKSLRLGYQGQIPGCPEKSITTNTSITYDADQMGLAFHSWWGWTFREQWTATFQADLLGIVSDKPVKSEGGVIRDYRANDRVSLGVSYEF